MYRFKHIPGTFLATGTMCFLALVNPSGASGQTDLLPDIIVRTSDLFDRDISDSIVPGRLHMRLSNGTANVGIGQLFLRGIDPPFGATTIDVMQRIFRTDNSWWERLAGTFIHHEIHGHMHFEDWAHYRLHEILPDNSAGPIVAQSSKVSFCIIDLEVYDATLPNFTDWNFGRCDTTLQGLSVGWIDIYSKEIPGQIIDVTDVPNGTYWLESEVDPLNHVLESDETNNLARIKIDLCLNEFQPPADTMILSDANGLPGSVVRVDVIATNSLPVRAIQVPFTWAGPLNLTFLSVSTAGLRTEYFEVLSFLGGDNANKIRAYQLRTSNTQFSQPDLAPGSGPVLSIFFRISPSAPDTTNSIVLVNNAVVNPNFITGCGGYRLIAGEAAEISLGCCQGNTGNVDGDSEDIVDIADLTVLIDNLFINFPPLTCPEEGNIDGDSQGLIDIGDLTVLIDNLFINFTPTAVCQ